MKEEQVTKAILKWLLENGWTIVCFDFPQSGTGRIIHPNGGNREKNKDSIIPDIVAVKDGICVFSENKDRFYYPDFQKQNMLKTCSDYSDAISGLLNKYIVKMVFYGIGLPISKYTQGAEDSSHLVDFILCVENDKRIKIVYNPETIPFLS